MSLSLRAAHFKRKNEGKEVLSGFTKNEEKVQITLKEACGPFIS